MADDPLGSSAVVRWTGRSPEGVQAVAGVCHPGVVTPLAWGHVPLPHVVTTWAPGLPLPRHLADGPLREVQTLAILAAVADALAACHHAEAIHGDLRPRNVIVDPKGGRITLVGFAFGHPPTPRFAAPDVLASGAGTAAGDVYSWGLLAWCMLHGRLPFGNLDPATALARRSLEAPHAEVGPGWLRTLLTRCLSPDPSRRPRSTTLVTAFDAHGVPLRDPHDGDLRRRGRTLWLGRPGVDDAVAAVLDGGGSLAIVGPDHSGRTHALGEAAAAAAARGLATVLLHPAAHPWGSVAAALIDPALPGLPDGLPPSVAPTDRAEAAAAALLRRAEGSLVVLVDDLHLLDPGTHATVRALDRLGVSLVMASTVAPGWVDDSVLLEPLTVPQAQALLTRTVGNADVDVLEEVARRHLSGQPGDLVRYAVAARAAGGLVWHGCGFVLDRVALATLDRDGLPASEGPRDTPTRETAALVAIAQPLLRREVMRIRDAAGTAEALTVLIDEGWLAGSDVLRCQSPRAAQRLAAGASDPTAVHRTLATHRMRSTPTPWAEVGASLVGSHDTDGVLLHGGRCVRAATDRDPDWGVRLAEAMWAMHATADLTAARIDASRRAGRLDDARRLGRAWIEGSLTEGDLPVVIALARAEDPRTTPGVVEQAREALGNDALPPELILEEARAWMALGDYRAADRRSAPLWQRPPDPPGPWLEAATLSARIRGELDHPSAGLRVLDTVPEPLGQGTRARAMLEAERGRLLCAYGDPALGASIIEAALGGPPLPGADRAALEDLAAACRAAAGDIRRAVEGWSRAVVRFDILGRHAEASAVRVELCRGLTALGRYPQAEVAGRRAVATARHQGLPRIEARGLCALGTLALGRGAFAAAQTCLDAADTVAIEAGLDPRLAHIALRRCELAARRRDPNALSACVRAEAAATRQGDRVLETRARVVRALVLARSGRHVASLRLANQSLADLRSCGDPRTVAEASIWVAEVRQTAGHPTEAASLAREVRQYAEAHELGPLLWRAQDIASWSSPPDADALLLQRLSALTLGILRQTEAPDILRELVVGVVDLCDPEGVAVFRGGEAEIRAGDAPPLDPRILDQVVRLQHQMWIHEPVHPEHQPPPRPILCLPFGDRVLAVVCRPGRRSPSLPRIQSLTDHAAIALGHAEALGYARLDADRVREAAHDLRNPLVGIALMAEDISGSGDPPTPDEARLIADGARHALALVGNTLQEPDEPATTFHWNQAVHEWGQAMEVQARRADVGLILDTSARGAVHGRPGQLRRVLTNLVGNAIRHTPAGGTVTLRTLSDDRRVGVEIVDGGSGIATAVASTLFDPGVQGPGAREGHGLGLAIVRRICREHGGDVSVEGSDRGARFVVELPPSDLGNAARWQG